MPAGHRAQSAAALRMEPSFESRANGTGFAVTPMIALRVGVSGGPHFHELAARQRGSYSGRERPAQPTKRIDSAAHAAGRTNRNFMCADHTGTGKRMNKYLS